MDPDKALDAIVMAMVDVSIGILTKDGGKLVNGALTMIEQYMNLSSWLHDGGSLPKYWQRDEVNTDGS